MALIHLNGRLVPESEALIPANDRAVLFGDGAYETVRSYAWKFLRFDAHLARMRTALAGIELDFPLSDEAIVAAADELIRANDIPDARIRLTITGGLHEGALRLRRPNPPNFIMSATPIVPPPADAYRDGVKALVAGFAVSQTSPLARLKAIPRLANLMAREEALQADCWDSIFCDERGNLLEGTFTNFFLVTGGTLRTAPLQHALLPGITRNLVLTTAREAGIKVSEDPVPRELLAEAEEAFITSTTIEILPLRQVGDTVIGDGRPGPVQRQLHTLYRETVSKELGVTMPPVLG